MTIDALLGHEEPTHGQKEASMQTVLCSQLYMRSEKKGSCSQEQQPLEQDFAAPITTFEDDQKPIEESDQHSLIATGAGASSTAQERVRGYQCKHEATANMAWSLGRELLMNDENHQRQVASATTQITGGRLIQTELEGLRNHRDDSLVAIYMHGIDARHVETRKRTINLENFGDWMDLYVNIRNAWIGHIGFHQHIRVSYIAPQPCLRDQQGMEGLHVIVDLNPERQGILILYMIDLQFGYLPNEEPIFETFRSFRERKSCNDMLEDAGYGHLCNQQGAFCRCKVGMMYYHGERLFECYDGAAITLEVQMRNPLQASGPTGDESSFMLMRAGARAICRRYFLYREGDAEPAIVERFDPEQVPIPGETEEDRIIYQYQHCEAFGLEERITIHRMHDQPEDLFAFRAVGYVLIDENQRQPGKVLIAADIGFFLEGSPLTSLGPKPHEEWREALYVQDSCTRDGMIRFLELRSFCREEEDQCMLWHRGISWPEADTEARTIVDGDHLVARVLQRVTALPLSQQWEFAQEECYDELLFGASHAVEVDPPEPSENILPIEIDAEQPIEEEEADDETSHLMTRIRGNSTRPSATLHALERLPPPGNG